jgi:hypothetical protein
MNFRHKDRFFQTEITVTPLRPKEPLTREEEERWIPRRFIGQGRRGARSVVTTPQNSLEMAAAIAIRLLES